MNTQLEYNSKIKTCHIIRSKIVLKIWFSHSCSLGTPNDIEINQ